MQQFRGLAAVFVLGLLLLALIGCSFFNGAPIASFNATPTTGPAPLDVQVNAASSLDPDGYL